MPVILDSEKSTYERGGEDFFNEDQKIGHESNNEAGHTSSPVSTNTTMKPFDFTSTETQESDTKKVSLISGEQKELNNSSSGHKAKNSKPSSSDMLFYYEKLLPFKHIFRWLNHSPKPSKDFTMREFAYEYRSGAYQRYNSFNSAEEFKESVIKANPTRFEVGAVYAINPRERKTVPKTSMKPLQKELVFDIDLTDYDEIRTCCSGTDICTKCWKFVTIATKIIDVALRDDFGFKHLIWVFSGRRGAHCWVSDKRARVLEEPQRRAIIEYLDVLKSKNSKRLNIRRPFHPHVERSFEMIKKEFVDVILIEQDPWRDNKKAEEMLKYLPDVKLAKELRDKWAHQKQEASSYDKWKDLDLIAKSSLDKKYLSAFIEAKKDIMIESLYPRLDVEVSRQMIHLLKSPFCIHPGTGNVCVPFDPREGFDPTTSPNLRQIQEEIEMWESKTGEIGNSNSIVKKSHDSNKTSLRPYIELFGKFVNDLLIEEMNDGKRQREITEDLEF